MSLFKHNAPRRGLYVVVQRIPGSEPFAGKPHDLDAARRVFDGVLANVPEGFFAPHTGASLHVVPLADWAKSHVAAARGES